MDQAEKTSSGSIIIDSLLNGGFEKGIITTIFGPGSSGKTNICLLTSINAFKEGKKVVYVDTEGNISVDRLKQLTPDYKNVLDNMIIISPSTLEDQGKSLRRLKSFANKDISLIIIDSAATPYRLELSEKDSSEVNNELGRQLSELAAIAKINDIPVILTNQVYSAMDETDNVRMVGGDLLKFSSKCVIELQKGTKGVRKAIIKRHRSIPEDKEAVFRIVEKGFESVTE